ncbi:MAG: PKD domain-containing protein [Bacteroidetes bacterium]|nr:PKD domain-containing protein [Bacteroidota bacterium]
MKKHLIWTFWMIVCGLTTMQAQQVNVSGTITDTGTGFGTANYPVEIVVYDSMSSNLVLQSTVYTDSVGAYQFSFPTINGPLLGNGEVNVQDCNGMIQSLHFAFNNGSANLTNFDFGICVPTAGCTASFMAIPQIGGTNVVFHDYSTTNLGAIVNWEWQFGDGDSAFGLNMLHNYPSFGTYLACLTITTNNGCTATFCDSVTVGSINANCQVTLNYGVFPSGAYGFSAAATGTGIPVNYFYDFGDGNTLSNGSDSVLYSYPNNGNYSACVTVMFSDSCIATGCVGVVTPNVACNASFSAIPDTSGQYSLLLVNNSWGLGLSYQWDFGDGGTSNAAYPSHTYAGPGTYMICLSVWDSTNTCTSTFCDSITVINKLGAAFTIQVVPGVLTAAASPAESFTEWSIFPNPATDRIQVKVMMERAGALRCKILDLSGRIMASEDAGIQSRGAHHFNLDVAGFAPGIYLLQVQTGMGSSTQKLVVAH